MASPLEDITPLYRIENPTIPIVPDDMLYNPAVAGQWFLPHIQETFGYIPRAGLWHGSTGAQLVIAKVPTPELEQYHASRHPIASTMSYDHWDYIIPRDGTVPLTEIDLSETLNDLSVLWKSLRETGSSMQEKALGRYRAEQQRVEARIRILGLSALSQ